jgi:UDP:flavonoid glycosyltransferase YjiC (YdhE family)
MSVIVLHSSGTMGDHLPLVALGCALLARGHRVRMAANEAARGVVERSGLSFTLIPEPVLGPEEARRDAWAWDHWNTPDIASHPRARRTSHTDYVLQIAALVDACRGADLLVSTSLRTHGLIASGVSGIPWITASVNPYAFWVPSSPEEKVKLHEVERRYYDLVKEPVDRAFAELGSEKRIPALARGWLWSRHVLLASSPRLSRPDLRQFAPGRSVDMTGFWFHDDPAWKEWVPDDPLAAFCDRSPLVLSFSSQPLEDPGRSLAMHVRAAALAGLPLLIQRGWAGFSEEMLPAEADRREILFADNLPHDWLFAKAAGSIQHGGIGSLARAIRQGCPLLIEPFGNDQIYNASRVHLLGLGAVMHPFDSTAEGMASVLATRVLTETVRAKSREIGERIAAEDGVGRGCDLIEAFLRDPEFDKGGPAVPLAALLAPRPASGATEGAGGGEGAIPRILHQTWKNADLPADLAAWRESWLANHPGWEHRLWTDEDNRELIRRDYPWFLKAYDSYNEPIKRADAVRYFILHRFGGVYADLDMESLRPIGPLLEGKQVVFGLEPDEHLAMHRSPQRPLNRIVCNAFMASVPGHPFWEHLFRELVTWQRAPGPLDATGPFMLTRACETWQGAETLSIEGAELLYPVSNALPWAEFSLEARRRIREKAFGIHHWRGGWYRDEKTADKIPCRLSLLEHGEAVLTAAVLPAWLVARLPSGGAAPLVSCLMVTRDRPALAWRAVECFLRQTWPRRELVIVDDGADPAIEGLVAALPADAGVVLVRLPDEGRSLGALRNVAVERASGELVAQWDDDDLYDPQRLELQVGALTAFSADACLLERERLWWPGGTRMATSCRRLWEGSMVARKGALIPYPDLRRGEDSPVVERLVADGRVVRLDRPDLYTYLFHGENTFGQGHWEEHWKAATERFEGGTAVAMAHAIGRRLQVDLFTVPATVAPTAPRVTVPDPAAAPPAAAEPAVPPMILVAVPVKDAVPYLGRFLANLRTLSHPHDRIRVAFLEGDSTDGTWEALQELLPKFREEFAGADAFHRDFGNLLRPSDRWGSQVQRMRRSVMAKARNELLFRALSDEEWVLWIDVDVESWPPDVIATMLAAGKEIVVPNCLSAKTGRTYDMNTFVLAPGAEDLDWDPFVVDGILQPPKGFGRLYLSDLRDREMVEVEGVGATMLLVRADLHREGLIFPTVPYKRYIETEGLSALAREMGYAAWGLPNLIIRHP